MKLMIVEDNVRMRQMIRKVIVRTIATVDVIDECSSGSEAIEHYARVQPDWVLMDIEMEPMDGLTASRKILQSHPGAKIIIVTNYDDVRYRRTAAAAGVRGYVLKENLNDIRAIIT